MAAYSETALSWQCYHTTHVMRCAQCSLIFCGKCHQSPVRQNVPLRKELLTSCPNCGELILIDISPEKRPPVVVTPPVSDRLRPAL